MRIQLETIGRLWDLLPDVIKELLQRKSDDLCKGAGDDEFRHEPPSMTPRCLLTDMVQELIYREEEGRDGNWDEFAGHWLPDDAVDEVLRCMKHQGWYPGRETF